jgi:hypothetical protein
MKGLIFSAAMIYLTFGLIVTSQIIKAEQQNPLVRLFFPGPIETTLLWPAYLSRPAP